MQGGAASLSLVERSRGLRLRDLRRLLRRALPLCEAVSASMCLSEGAPTFVEAFPEVVLARSSRPAVRAAVRIPSGSLQTSIELLRQIEEFGKDEDDFKDLIVIFFVRSGCMPIHSVLGLSLFSN